MKKFVLVEIQTNSDGTVSVLNTAYDDRFYAEGAYHSVLASAALSSLPCHSAVLLESDGTFLDSQYYEH